MRKYLFTGFVILLPLALTIMVIFFLFDLFTAPFVTIVGTFIEFIKNKLYIHMPEGITLLLSRILSLIFLCLFILLLGMITQLFLVKSLLNWGNRLLFRIPFIKTIYKVSKDVFSALFSTDGKKAFKRPVMVPFPSEPNYCLGFEAGEVAEEIQEKVKTPLVSVFAPTAPHPISGFLFLVPKNDVLSVEMNNEEVLKFLVSCGMLLPDSEKNEEEDEEPF